MPREALRTVAIGIAVSAAWLAAPVAGYGPALWVALLLAILAVQPEARTLIDLRWAGMIAVILLLSWFASVDHEADFRHTLLALAAILVFSLARMAPPTSRGLEWGALLIAVAGFLAIDQALGGLASARHGISGLLPALRPAAAARIAIGRAFGTAALPGHFAVMMAMVVPMVATRAFRERGWGRVPWLVGATACIGGIVATRSLAAVLALAVAITLVLGRRRRAVVVVGIAGVVVVAAVVAALRGDLATLAPLRLRWVNWSTAVWVFAHHPLVGVGLGGVGQAGLTSPYAAANISPFAHCTPLQIAAELGLAGVAVAALATFGLVRLVRGGLEACPALAIGVLVVALHNLVDFSFYAPEVLLPWCVLAGSLSARVAPPVRRAVPAVVLVTVLILGSFAATAQWRGESGVSAALAGPNSERAEGLLTAASWQPWSVTPVLAAAEAAITGPATPALRARVEEAVKQRGWVRPLSPAWAEALARLEIVSGAPGRALPWAAAARERAPWRRDLVELEQACRGK